MADTVRTVAALAALFADNTTADISPQDLRDFLVSAEPDRGEIYWSSTSATSPANTNDYYLVAGTTTLSSGAVNFSMPSNGRLRYDGTPTRAFHVAVAASQTTETANQVIHYRLAKGGTTIASTEVQRLQASPTDVGAFALNHVTTLATNDYIELYIRNATTATDVTIEVGNIVIWGGMD